MSTFSPIRQSTVYTKTENDTTVEFTTTDGSPDVSGYFKNADGHTVGQFSFSPTVKSLNIYVNEGVDFSTADILDLLGQVDAFLSAEDEE